MKYPKNIFLVSLFFIVIFAFSIVNSYELKTGQLKVTTEHPFLQDGEWIPSKQLEKGDTITTKDGRKATITSIRKVKKNTTVYNLEDEKYHNYIVDGLVVHNSNLPDYYFFEGVKYTEHANDIGLEGMGIPRESKPYKVVMNGGGKVVKHCRGIPNMVVREVLSNPDYIFHTDTQSQFYDGTYFNFLGKDVVEGHTDLSVIVDADLQTVVSIHGSSDRQFSQWTDNLPQPDVSYDFVGD